jgi:phosphopantetheinyl transferase (holo-ACP synthase)
MVSAGNDIVSLVANDTERAIRPVFYKKILSDTEVAQYQQYQNDITFVNYIWLLWSAKEAAFKYLQRLDPGLVFSPTRYIVTLLCAPAQAIPGNFEQSQAEYVGFDNAVSWIALVKHYSKTVYARSMLYPNVIHSVVNGHENFENVYWGIKTIQNTHPENQSSAVRKFLSHRLHGIFGNKIPQLFKSEYGFPIILNGITKMFMPASFSHHEGFIAYSFALK